MRIFIPALAVWLVASGIAALDLPKLGTTTAAGKMTNTAATTNPTGTDTATQTSPTDATSKSAGSPTTKTGTDLASATTTLTDQTTAPTSLPGLSSSKPTAYDGITGAPSVTGGIPNYPAPTVPPTAQAPFMKKSTAPSGTVFIAVGAILGFAFTAFLGWRSLVAWSLHRSMRRANQQPPTYDSVRNDPRASMLHNAAPFYTNGVGSQMSLDHLSGGRRLAAREAAGSLYFSPTAGAVAPQGQQNRASSAYLPAGYYSAGSAAATTTPAAGRPISMADFTRSGPQSQGYQRAQSMATSPPVSPLIGPAPGMEMLYDGEQARVPSTTSLTIPPQGRTPSAYLDDLFDHPPAIEDSRSDVERY